MVDTKIEKPYLLHLLMSRSNWMAERVYDNADHNGYGDVTPAMSRMFALIVGEPKTLSELARQLSVTRQAIHKLALEASRLGYVRFVESDTDARVKLLKFTAKGKDMARSAEQELIQIETLLTKRIGVRRMRALKEALALPWDAHDMQGRGDET